MEWSGTVVRKLLRRGTKSEHRSLALATAQGEFKLRRKGGNPFVDDVLEQLEGRKIRCSGELIGDEIFMDTWTVESSE